MAEQPLHTLSDRDLEATLRSLSPAIAWPSDTRPGQPDLATSIRARVESEPVPGRDWRAWLVPAPWWRWSGRPARRALVLALVALLAVAAIAGAVGLGLPGLRLILGEGPPGLTPASVAPASFGAGSPTPDLLGGSMRLGEALAPTDPAGIDTRAGFHVHLPTDPLIGTPDAAWIDDQKGGQVTLLWTTRPSLPTTLDPEIGLLLSQFRGAVETGYFTKVVHGGTVVERVRVAGSQGYWLSGDPHLFFWDGPDGFVDDPRRWVGDVLLWSDGAITYRLETSLGRDDAVRIAESLR